MKDRQPSWQNQMNEEIARRQTEKPSAGIVPPQISPEELERNRQGELSKKRVAEALRDMVIFNTDIVPVLSSFNQEVWDNLGNITVSDYSLKGFSGKWTEFIEKFYGFQSITLTHESTAYSGEYEKVVRGRFGKHTRSGGSGGGWNSPEAATSWSREAFGSYREVGHRLVKIDQKEVTDSISVTLGYSDMTGLFELRVADSEVGIESGNFTEFPDKRRIHDPSSQVTYRDNGEIIAYLTDDRYDACLYDIVYEQLYRDPTVRPATDLPDRLMYRNPYGPKSRYKKVPFVNYTLVSYKGQVALFFGKDAVDRDRILDFLNRALVVAGTNRKINKRLPQNIDWKNREELKDLQSRLGKKDFSAPRIEWN